MISVIATNITSPLGFTTDDNYRAVREYRSRLERYDSWRGIPESFVASMFDAEQRAALAIGGYTLFESMVIRSVADALTRCEVDVESSRTVFILSSTKGNVDELSGDGAASSAYLPLGHTARKIADYFGFKSEPIVVCNACISGVDAQVLAQRLLLCGEYDTAVVCGADVVTPFVVSGFLSFKSLAIDHCRPFDIERTGLNLGEAAATIILARNADDAEWQLCAGYMSNDAYHLSAPAPDGRGLHVAISKALEVVDVENLALINAHGTATMFNDQMESKAIERAALGAVPLSAIKGYYGHTLGAAGVLESVINMRALDDGIILGVRGYDEIGVSGKINISGKERTTQKRSFLKMISGFGGCNGVLLFAKTPSRDCQTASRVRLQAQRRVHLTHDSVVVDGEPLQIAGSGKSLLTGIYKNYVGNYPKFYKMDIFSRLVFLATELLVGQDRGAGSIGQYSIVLFNSSSSIVTDRKHSASIGDAENFYPSPSLFLYTLPNIALGEVAIRQECMGESSLYILAQRDEQLQQQVVESLAAYSACQGIITGWVECSNEDCFEADLQILTK